MTKVWKITTKSTCITTYHVDAETQEEAEDNFWEGQYYNENEIDFQDEDIIETKLVSY